MKKFFLCGLAAAFALVVAHATEAPSLYDQQSDLFQSALKAPLVQGLTETEIIPEGNDLYEEETQLFETTIAKVHSPSERSFKNEYKAAMSDAPLAAMFLSDGRFQDPEHVSAHDMRKASKKTPQKKLKLMRTKAPSKTKAIQATKSVTKSTKAARLAQELRHAAVEAAHKRAATRRKAAQRKATKRAYLTQTRLVRKGKNYPDPAMITKRGKARHDPGFMLPKKRSDPTFDKPALPASYTPKKTGSWKTMNKGSSSWPLTGTGTTNVHKPVVASSSVLKPPVAGSPSSRRRRWRRNGRNPIWSTHRRYGWHAYKKHKFQYNVPEPSRGEGNFLFPKSNFLPGHAPPKEKKEYYAHTGLKHGGRRRRAGSLWGLPSRRRGQAKDPFLPFLGIDRRRRRGPASTVVSKPGPCRRDFVFGMYKDPAFAGKRGLYKRGDPEFNCD